MCDQVCVRDEVRRVLLCVDVSLERSVCCVCCVRVCMCVLWERSRPCSAIKDGDEAERVEKDKQRSSLREN